MACLGAVAGETQRKGQAMRRVISQGLALVAFVLAGVVLISLGTTDSGRATGFSPTGDLSVSDTAPGAHPDLTVDLTLDAPDSIFSSVISFIPSAWGLAGCPVDDPDAASRDCADLAIPDGSLVGRVESDSTLGLLNGSCSTQLDLIFDLMDATTDMSTTVVFHDVPDDTDVAGEQFEDDDADGIPNGAAMYPDYLMRLIRTLPFGVDGSEVIQPISRTYSQIKVASTVDNVSVQFLVLEPGGMINGLPLDPSLGFPVVLVLNNLGDPGQVAQPGPITSFCSSLSSVGTSFGMTEDNPDTVADESGVVYLTNPSDGGYNMTLFVISEYDADGDGIENPLDPCPTQGNTPGWDPRDPNSPGDDDADGIPNICDPTPNENVGPFDQDGDTFQNRVDTCPLVANPDQMDIDRDDIGDVCDPDPLATSGHPHIACIVKEVDIGTGGDPAEPHPLAVPPCVLNQPVLYGDVDCSGTVDSVDMLFILRFVVNEQPAPLCIDVADLQCDGDKDVVDALQGLRFLAALSVNQQPGCPLIGTPV